MYRSFILIMTLIVLAFSIMFVFAETTPLKPSQDSTVTQEKDSERLGDKSFFIVIGEITSVKHAERDRRIGISEYDVEILEVIKGANKLKSFGREKDFKVQIATWTPDKPDITKSLKEGTIAIFFIQGFKGVFAALTDFRTIAVFPEGAKVYKEKNR